MTILRYTARDQIQPFTFVDVAADVTFDDNSDCRINDIGSVESGATYLPTDVRARHRVHLHDVTWTHRRHTRGQARTCGHAEILMIICPAQITKVNHLQCTRNTI